MKLTLPRHCCLTLVALLVGGASAAQAQSPEATRAMLFERERESHQQWLRGDLAALDTLMADEFHFVVMNGAIETKAIVLGTGDTAAPATRPLQVNSLTVEPEQFLLRANTAIVISVLHIDASARGRPLPGRMRILSVFTNTGEDPDWRLTARSITPILPPPGSAHGGAEPD